MTVSMTCTKAFFTYMYASVLTMNSRFPMFSGCSCIGSPFYSPLGDFSSCIIYSKHSMTQSQNLIVFNCLELFIWIYHVKGYSLCRIPPPYSVTGSLAPRPLTSRFNMPKFGRSYLLYNTSSTCKITISP